MTAASTRAHQFGTSRSSARSTTTAPLVVIAAAGIVSLLLRCGGAGGVLAGTGPVLLAVAVVLGMPHGALDLEAAPGGPTWQVPVPSSLAYLAAAGAVFACWRVAPGLTVGLLLVIAAAHFAASDVAVDRDDRAVGAPERVRAAVTSIFAVGGPFACWPHRAGTVLAALGVHAAAGVIITASTVAVGLAVLPAIVLTIRAALAADTGAAAQPLAVALLVVAAPPLVSFAVFFAGWHALRQTAHLVRRQHVGAADQTPLMAQCLVRRFAVRAAVPTVVALLAVAGLIVALHGVTGTLLAALLAVSVPHAIVELRRDHLVVGRAR